MGTTTAEVKTKALKVKVATDIADGERTITAVVSSSNVDRDYEVVDVPSLRLPLKGGGYVKASDLTGTEPVDLPMLLNHSYDVEDVIGSVRSAYLNQQQELVVVFGISGRAKAQDLMLLIDEQHLDNAFSITMSDYDYQGNTIYDAEVVEISLVFRGSNKDARVLAVKTLLGKDRSMAEAKQTLAEKQAEIARLQKEIDSEDVQVTENDVVNVEVVDAPVEAETEAKEEEAEEEAPAESTPVEEVVAEEEAPQVNVEVKQVKETPKMAKDTIAVKQVKEPVAVEIVEAKAKMSKSAQKELFVKQFMAYQSGDKATLADLNKQAKEADTADDEVKAFKSKAIGDADATSIYQTEVVSSAIQEEYTNVGRVGSLVSRINISGAETWKQIVQTAGNGFQPVGIQELKQEDKPTWTHLSIEPKEHAMVVAWYDAVAKRTPLAVFDVLVRYIASEYAKLEDKIVLSFAGVTTSGGDVFAGTGIVPIITTAGRIKSVADYSSTALISAFGEAYGELETDNTLTIVANRKTWGNMATSLADDGRPTFSVVGSQVSAGALGTFNVALSQEMEDGDILIGAFGDYQLVTNGGLETLFSQEATVGSLNLFTGNASAIRASVDLAGKPVRNTSFYLLQVATS